MTTRLLWGQPLGSNNIDRSQAPPPLLTVCVVWSTRSPGRTAVAGSERCPAFHWGTSHPASCGGTHSCLPAPPPSSWSPGSPGWPPGGGGPASSVWLWRTSERTDWCLLCLSLSLLWSPLTHHSHRVSDGSSTVNTDSAMLTGRSCEQRIKTLCKLLLRLCWIFFFAPLVLKASYRVGFVSIFLSGNWCW